MDELLRRTVLDKAEARGLAIIICNNYQMTTPNYESLRGTFKDGSAMEETFEHLGFATITLRNAREDEMCGIVKAVATYHPYPKGYNCYAVVFSGHGSNNKTIVSSDGELVKFEEAIIRPLHPKNAHFICNSPKIILIDACRGRKELRAKGDPPETVPARFDLSLPGNVFVAYSTMEGYKSYETNSGGVWMQELAVELRKGQKSVGDIVAGVNKTMRDRGLSEPQIWNTTVDIILSACPG